MTAIRGDRRYKGTSRCPICDGADQDPRGAERRCFGFLSEDGFFAHCSREEHAGTIVKRPGSDTYPHRLAGPCKCGRQHSAAAPVAQLALREVAVYDYIDEQGVLLYQVVRREPIEQPPPPAKRVKTFAQRRPPVEPGGKWIYGLTDKESGKTVRRVLYRLDRILEADPEQTVWIVEGEKDVHALERLGQVATCNPGGAGKWSLSQECASAALVGRRCIIIADPDEKGRPHARDVEAKLRGVAASVLVMELPGGVDAHDWVEAGGTSDQLMTLAAAPPVTVGPPVLDATRDFERDESGKIYHSQANVRLALAKLGVSVRYDLMAHRIELDGMPGCGRHLDKISGNRLRLKIDEEFLLRLGKDLFGDVVLNEAWTSRYHPVVDWLALQQPRWDGKRRLGSVGGAPSWLTTYGGAADSDYTRAVGRLVLVAAVRRVRSPGCKFDEMLILEGKAGRNKSQALGVLAIRKEWFTDDLSIDDDTKKLMEQTSGKWIVECPEIDLSRANYKRVKGYLSRTEDRSRMAYGEFVEEISRQFVLIATTNEEGYFEDHTGNRKFWPVAIHSFDLEALRRDVEQIWAEAATAESDGESIRLDSSLWEAAAAQQQARMHIDPIDVKVSQLLGDLEGKVLTSDIWKVCESTNKVVTKAETKLVGKAMRLLGWKWVQLSVGGGRKETYYLKGEGKMEIVVEGLGYLAAARYK